MEGFTTRRVSARAGISHGMCHYHFKDKNDLVLALVEHARDDWITPLEEMVKGPGSAESRARAVINWMAEPATMEVLRVHLTLQWFALQDEPVRRHLAAEYARWRHGFAELFGDLAIEQGLSRLDAAAVGEAFASAADGLVHQQSLDPKLDTKGVLTALFEKVAEIERPSDLA
jgi:AcrR family transcriptional regulator